MASSPPVAVVALGLTALAAAAVLGNVNAAALAEPGLAELQNRVARQAENRPDPHSHISRPQHRGTLAPPSCSDWQPWPT